MTRKQLHLCLLSLIVIEYVMTYCLYNALMDNRILQQRINEQQQILQEQQRVIDTYKKINETSANGG